MKRTRLLVSVLLAVLLLAVSVAPAMAASSYTGKTGGTYTITETLKLEKADTVVPNVTYTLALDGGIRNQAGTELGTDANVYSGQPTISTNTVTFNSNSQVQGSSGNYGRFVTGNFVIDFTGVTFYEPGVYRYNLTKTATSEDLSSEQIGQDKLLTNTRSSDYVLLYVANNEGSATLADVQYFMENKTGEYVNSAAIGKSHIDRYQSSTSHLRLSKNVTGNMASQSQYFQFSIKLTGGIAGSKYEVTGEYQPTTDLNAHHETRYDNVSLLKLTQEGTNKVITLDDNGEYSGTVWLKHGQGLSINGLPGDISYELSEVSSEGYTKSVVGNESGITPTTGTDEKPANIHVAYTNTKTSDVPTGINLQTAAPVFGIVLVGLLLAVLLMSKRRENL